MYFELASLCACGFGVPGRGMDPSAATSGRAVEILEATNLNMIYVSTMNVTRL